MFCSKCGSSVAEGVAFCPNCGQATGGVTPGVAIPQAIPAAAYAGTAVAAVAPGAVAVGAMQTQYAGFWLRFVAWIIDRIVLQVVSGFVLFPLFGAGLMRTLMHMRNGNPDDVFPLMASMSRLFFAALIVNWLYYALLESSTWQGTLGKKALGLQVTDYNLQRISFGRATGRYFARIISAMTLFIGYIMAGFTQRKQALHDMIAGTLVVKQMS
jgi:uncharacterized RDD family membrane protein YckC